MRRDDGWEDLSALKMFIEFMIMIAHSVRKQKIIGLLKKDMGNLHVVELQLL